MAWTVNWMYMILMTSLTGGVFTLIWYGVSRALERTGYLNITYKMLKVILIFWYCPFMYYLLLYMDRYTALAVLRNTGDLAVFKGIYSGMAVWGSDFYLDLCVGICADPKMSETDRRL